MRTALGVLKIPVGKRDLKRLGGANQIGAIGDARRFLFLRGVNFFAQITGMIAVESLRHSLRKRDLLEGSQNHRGQAKDWSTTNGPPIDAHKTTIRNARPIVRNIFFRLDYSILSAARADLVAMVPAAEWELDSVAVAEWSACLRALFFREISEPAEFVVTFLQ